MYQFGAMIVAFSFLIDGICGLTLSKTAKLDFQRCFYVVIERFAGGVDLEPSHASIESIYFYFNFVFNLDKLLKISLFYLILQGRHLTTASSLGLFLTVLDMILFTNPIAQASHTET